MVVLVLAVELQTQFEPRTGRVLFGAMRVAMHEECVFPSQVSGQKRFFRAWSSHLIGLIYGGTGGSALLGLPARYLKIPCPTPRLGLPDLWYGTGLDPAPQPRAPMPSHQSNGGGQSSPYQKRVKKGHSALHGVPPLHFIVGT